MEPPHPSAVIYNYERKRTFALDPPAAMRHRLLFLIVLVVATFLAGCATDSGKPIATAALASPPEAKGRIVFYRLNTRFGETLRADIRLDGKKIVESVAGEKFFVDVAPGEHRISVPYMLFSGEKAINVTLSSQQTVYVRTSLGGSAVVGHTNVELIPPEKGASESAALRPASAF